jgi:hypothetical protein
MTKLTFKENMTKSDMFKKMHKTKVKEFKALPVEQQKKMIAEFKEMTPSEKEVFRREMYMLAKLQSKEPDAELHNDYTKVSYRAITADNFDKIERLTKELENVRLTEKVKEEMRVEIETAKSQILYQQTGINDAGYEKSQNLIAKGEKLQSIGNELEKASQKMARKGVKYTAMAWAPLPYLGYSIVRDAHRGGKHGKQEEIQILPDTSNGESELVGMVKGIETALNNGIIEKEQAKEMLNDFINNKY